MRQHETPVREPRSANEQVSGGAGMTSAASTSDWSAVLAQFEGWLAPRRLAARSRGTYLQRAGRFCAFVHARASAGDGPPLEQVLADRHQLSYAARDWRLQLLTVDKATISTVNVSLAALAALGESRGLGPLEVDRVDQPRQAPAALDRAQARDLLRTAQRTSVREHALVSLLHATGLRISEAAALDVNDVPTTARTGQVLVRAGKGAKPRTVPLTGNALAAVRAWLSTDEHQPGRRAALPAAAAGERALWIGQRGRLSVRQLQRTLEHLGRSAGLEGFTAHQLRHTAATRWLRSGIDLVIVAAARPRRPGNHPPLHPPHPPRPRRRRRR